MAIVRLGKAEKHEQHSEEDDSMVCRQHHACQECEMDQDDIKRHWLLNSHLVCLCCLGVLALVAVCRTKWSTAEGRSTATQV